MSTIYKVRRIALVTLNAVGDNEGVAAVAAVGGNSPIPAKKIRVMGGLLVATAAGTIQLNSGTSSKTALTGPMPVAINGQIAISPSLSEDEYAPIETKAGEPLTITTTGAGQIVNGFLVIAEVL